MSTQHGSMVKPMKHGFASRNSLFSALIDSRGYTGINSVLEMSHGGFVSTFWNGRTRAQPPSITPHQITEELGTAWKIQNITLNPEWVEGIVVETSEPAFKKRVGYFGN
jgi:2-methylcitrate dehydratase PrpD